MVLWKRKVSNYYIIHFARERRVIESASRMLIQLLISIDHNAHEGQNGSRCRSERGKHFNYRLSPVIIRFASTSLSLSISLTSYKAHSKDPSYFHLLYSQWNKLNKRLSFFALTVSRIGTKILISTYHQSPVRFPFNNVKNCKIPLCLIMR